MNIQSSRIQSNHYARPSRLAVKPQAGPTDSFTFSNDSGLNKLGRGIGGGIAGSMFSGLLLSLPLSLAPAFGIETQTALNAYGVAVLTAGVAGGLASAAMPPGQNWY